MNDTAGGVVSARGSPLRFAPHWRKVAWSGLDKSLIFVFGLAFMLVVVRTLPAVEFGLQAIASTLVWTLAPLLRYLILVPTTKYVAEGREPARVGATGALLYVAASAIVALALFAGRGAWASCFHKPELAPVLVPTAALVALGSWRDAAIATLEGQRLFRRVFVTNLAYYVAAIAALLWWRRIDVTPDAVSVQWAQAFAAGAGTLAGLVAAAPLWRAVPAAAEARRILQLGRDAFGSGLGTTVGQHADSILAGALMGKSEVASYQTAKLLYRAFNLVGLAVYPVLMSVVSKLHAQGRQHDLRVLYEKSACFLHVAVGPVVVLGLVLAQPLYAVVYGERYADSLGAFRILVLGALTMPLANTGGPFLLGIGRVRTLLWTNWLATLLAVLTAIVCIPRWGPSGAALALVAGRVAAAVSVTAALKPVLGFRLRDVAARVRDVASFVQRAWRAKQGSSG